MTTIHNRSAQPKQKKLPDAKAYLRSPYREHTKVVRVPDSLLPTIRKLLVKCRQDV